MFQRRPHSSLAPHDAPLVESRGKLGRGAVGDTLQLTPREKVTSFSPSCIQCECSHLPSIIYLWLI